MDVGDQQGPVRELEVSAEVAGLVGMEDLELILDGARRGYDCVICQAAASGVADHPAALLLLTDGQMTRASLAHAACAPSQVLRMEPGSLAASTPGTTTAHAVASLLPAAAGARPMLIVDLGEMSIGSAAERKDAMMTVALGAGLHLVDRLGRMLPESAGWRVELTGPGTLTVQVPGLGAIYEGTCGWTPAWQARVVGSGRVELLLGSGLRLATVTGSGDLAGQLHKAARRGLLAGGLVAVTGLR